ncbi:stage II sporulation protein GA (sporulation sigma-E factor processing peptidase) [Desulfonispora thiosulfatigenes DSM 11270]|uniref:Sporulation sigma-E factor-processing peptidase n=1 Tax=Desulfonispora thiosulfatigenes DSM 11270 TaxID=656914 RepID=A0A1W1VSR0_DESTI|nr:sigma-E processing peptidase SpoIIGA [Desulfonispora thiosulfatigenes]SMB96412.1 stage II sporulation protein GA (sporulation sigma-E factor processing peptidase) [Desulfonispora thiosulfatigenes DSM 11270]
MSPYTDMYLDIAFMINFIMDFFILWATSRLGRLSTNYKRLTLGAFIGAAYSIMIYFPRLAFSSTVLLKLVCSFLMVIVTFRYKNIKWFIKSTSYFYLVSFIMGGAVLGSMYLFQSGPLHIETWNGIMVNSINFSGTWLIVGLAVALLLGMWSASIIRKNLHQGIWLVKTKVKILGTSVDTEALVDTGNQLKDPISKDPVMVMEYDKLTGIIPDDLTQMLKSKNIPSIDVQVGTFKDDKWNTRIRLIPFSSLGNHNGMLIGIKPDEVMIQDGNNLYKNSNVVVAIYHRKLSPQGTYHALLHTDLLLNE